MRIREVFGEINLGPVALSVTQKLSSSWKCFELVLLQLTGCL